MKRTVRGLVILTMVFTLMVMTASVALAHDGSGSDGTAHAPTQSPVPFSNNTQNDANDNGFAQQVPHNPTCRGHDN